MHLKIYPILIIFTGVIFTCLCIILLVGCLNFQGKDTNSSTFHTLSSIIANNDILAMLYASIVFLYGFMKILAGFSFYYIEDSTYVQKTNTKISNKNPFSNTNFISKNPKLFKTLIIFIFLCMFVQVFCMNAISYVPVTTQHDLHMILAKLAFGAAIVKSISLFFRRLVLRLISGYKWAFNLIYILVQIILAFVFLETKNALYEWFLMALIIGENLFIAHDFKKHKIDISISTNKTEDKFNV